MEAQGTRIRVITENVANASSLPAAPGDEPYRRKLVTFKNQLDRELGVDTVRIDRVLADPTPFQRQYDPAHPAADEAGYVLTPNVNSLIEMADLREAERSYEANLNTIRTAKTMLQDTIDILR
jgi:flagellar basal-body rod protein FlgC